MKDFNFLKFEISDNDHVIITADPALYKVVRSGIFDSFDDYIHDDYKKVFSENLALADNRWFPARILSDDGSDLFLIRVSRKKTRKTSILRMTMISVDELFDSHAHLEEAVSTYKSQLELYDDVFFNFDLNAQTVTLANTQIADFDAGVYSIEQIEELLCQKVSPDKQDDVKSFIGQAKSKVGHFSTRIEANLINNDSKYLATILEASYVFFSNGKEHVVGHMHLEHKRKNANTSSLKRDSLTGLLEKTEIMKLAKERVDDRRLEGTTLAIVDIDFFKNFNDTYGHRFGDTVIKRIADIIASEVGNNGMAGRFGGDEFLLVFYNIRNEEELRYHFRNIKRRVGESALDEKKDDKVSLSLSIGAASFSGDADNYDDLFMLADHCLYIAKEKGRNRYIIYNREKHGSLEAIQQQEVNKKILDGRGGTSYGDEIIKMYNMVLHGEGASVENLMEEFAQLFGLQRVSLLVGTPFSHRYTAGKEKSSGFSSPNILLGMLNSDIKEKYLAGRDFVVVNKIDTLPPQAEAAKAFLRKIGVLSYILLRFNDHDGNECFMIISSVGKYLQWNELHFKYYKAFVDLLSIFSLKS